MNLLTLVVDSEDLQRAKENLFPNGITSEGQFYFIAESDLVRVLNEDFHN